MRINGFEQIKAFYSWVFNEPEKARPSHISLYLFLLNQNNRANWVEWFKCPYDLAMHGARIGSKSTYYNCLDDLKKWKIIDYKKGINNYKAPLIKLFQLYKSGQVTVPLSEQVSEPASGQLFVPLSEPLTGKKYKLLTDNIKLITDNIEEVLIFLKEKNKNLTPKQFYESELQKSGSDNYKKFINFLYGNNDSKAELSGVLSLQQQVTYEQFEKLLVKAKSKNVILKDMIMSMENTPKYYKGKKSLYLTLNNWINRK